MATEEDKTDLTVPEDVKLIERGGFRCLLCGVSTPNREPKPHCAPSCRRHVRLCEERDKRQQQQERSVYVGGFPRDTTEEQLRNLFESISPVKSIVMDKNRALYAIVEFESTDGVSMSLTTDTLKIGEKALKVKPREKKEFQLKKAAGPRNLQPPDSELLSKELVQCIDVDDQMKKLVSLCSPSHNESRLRQLLLSLMQETFTEFFPGCQLLPFGSSVNGFEITGCDLDLYLELGEEKEKTSREGEIEVIEEEAEGEEKKQMDTKESPDVTPGLSLQGLSSEQILELVEKVLRRCVPGVHGVRSVPSARRPVIRFQHKTSGLRGDVTLNNRLALRNSSFLRFCSDLDPRIPPLVYTVRYWARVHQLAGNPLGGGPLLNNYALTLLVIFFLQTRSPPVIPTLSKLRAAAVNEVPQVIDGWDCTLCTDISQIQSSENQQNLSCLLSEFFSYLSSLNLASLILCPCDGTVLPLPLPSPSPSWLEGFRLGPFNIQDPFELSHNVCGNVSLRAARRFSSQCTSAAQTCRTSLYRLRSRARPWGAPLIFLPPPSDDEKKTKAGTEILVPVGKVPLEVACSAVRKVLEDVLLCTCEEINGMTEEEGTAKGKADCKTLKGRKSDCGEQKLMEDEQTVPCKEEFMEKQGDEGAKCETQAKKRERTELSEKDVRRKKKKTEVSREDVCVKYSDNSGKKEETPASSGVWEGRRKERRRRRGGEAKGMELETAISHMFSSGRGENIGGEALMTMTMTVQMKAPGQTLVHLTPNSDPHTLSQVFFHFLGGFLPRMVKEILGIGE
uniref:Speckle targeted PIP5K1A-regulated poly(A) polymerase n=1 Tax=Leptobrachium leishanense TaxID=445787 RepID=A0A8C5QU85_9ANUR